MAQIRTTEEIRSDHKDWASHTDDENQRTGERKHGKIREKRTDRDVSSLYHCPSSKQRTNERTIVGGSNRAISDAYRTGTLGFGSSSSRRRVRTTLQSKSIFEKSMRQADVSPFDLAITRASCQLSEDIVKTSNGQGSLLELATTCKTSGGTVKLSGNAGTSPGKSEPLAGNIDEPFDTIGISTDDTGRSTRHAG